MSQAISPTELCAQCRRQPADVAVTDVDKEGQTSEIRLCRQCAQARGVLAPSDKPGSSREGRVTPAQEERLVCPTCGISYASFKKDMRLGCEQCYAAFADRLAPIVKRIHGTTRHTGRLPQKNPNAAREFEVQRLGQELRKAIAAEDYERAAAVRDEIRKTGSEGEDSSPGPGTLDASNPRTLS